MAAALLLSHCLLRVLYSVNTANIVEKIVPQNVHHQIYCDS